jgi:tRNA A37 N6-isopentenylltransferase MiaA
VIGLDEIATLPREEAIAALTVRTRRYAAYQRKWMRNLEGVVMVAADRPTQEIAAEIVELARTREHLSRP